MNKHTYPTRDSLGVLGLYSCHISYPVEAVCESLGFQYCKRRGVHRILGYMYWIFEPKCIELRFIALCSAHNLLPLTYAVSQIQRRHNYGIHLYHICSHDYPSSSSCGHVLCLVLFLGLIFISLMLSVLCMNRAAARLTC